VEREVAVKRQANEQAKTQWYCSSRK